MLKLKQVTYLETEARRLIRQARFQRFIRIFVAQWQGRLIRAFARFDGQQLVRNARLERRSLVAEARAEKQQLIAQAQEQIDNGNLPSGGDSSTDFAYSYDADGNLLSDTKWTYTYNAENRLISND